MGEKETEGKISFQEIDPEFMALFAHRLSRNKDKYPVGNWKKSIDINLLIDSIDRHLIDLKLLIDGKEPILNPDEIIQDHLAAITANCQFINWQLKERGWKR